MNVNYDRLCGQTELYELLPLLLMMKSFILAATSIAYTLSIANISDAKIKISAKKIEHGQICLEQTAHPSQVYDISTSDIRGICQVITKYYTERNKSTKRIQDVCNQTSNCDDRDEHDTRAFEVKKLELEYYSKDRATVNIQMINRLYDWRKKQWVLSNETLVVFKVNFIKKSGKWSYDEKEFLYM